MKFIDEGGNSMHHESFSWTTVEGDFGTALRALASIIFLLTSFRVDSIHQSVATKYRCEIP